jgi:hypothetical protein
MLVGGQSPPTIIPLFHKRKFRPGRIGELVEKFNPQTGINKRVDQVAKTVIPNVRDPICSLVISGIRSSPFNPLRLL